MTPERGVVAYAVGYCSREVLATTEGRRLMEDMLIARVRRLGPVVPLSERFIEDPFERHGDLDAPLSTPTSAVLKLACRVVVRPVPGGER